MVTRSARLESFITGRFPEASLQAQALAEDHVGTYILPFPCRNTDGVWYNGLTGEPVQARIVGWHEFQTVSQKGMSPAQQVTIEP
jgi:hypothetical protein